MDDDSGSEPEPDRGPNPPRPVTPGGRAAPESQEQFSFPPDQAAPRGHPQGYTPPGQFPGQYHRLGQYSRVGRFPSSRPPFAPRRSAPVRSPFGVALLNLTGLGIGYAYLGRWWRFALHLGGTVVLVAVAFATDAASLPWVWRAIAVAWVGWMVVDGWRLARTFHPAPRGVAGHLLPALVAVVLAVAVVAGYLVYAAAGRAAYAAGTEALGRGDCAAATSEFDRVTGVYELTLSPEVVAAESDRGECDAFTAAAGADGRGAHEEAATRYEVFRRDHPASPLAPLATARLVDAYDAWATALISAGRPGEAVPVLRRQLEEVGAGPAAPQIRERLAATYVAAAEGTGAALAAGGTGAADAARTAVENLLVVAREFGDTAAAARVPEVLAATYTAAATPVAAGTYCESLPVLDYLATRPDAEMASVVATADTAREQARYQCAVIHYDEEEWAEAITQFAQFVTAYPDDPAVAQAQSALIAARVGAAGGTPPQDLPAPLGGDSPGVNELRLFNYYPRDIVVLVAGQTAHEVTIPACTDCPEVPAVDEGCPVDSTRPSVTLRLRAGDYSVVSLMPDGITPAVSAQTIQEGFVHAICTVRTAS